MVLFERNLLHHFECQVLDKHNQKWRAIQVDHQQWQYYAQNARLVYGLQSGLSSRRKAD